MRIEIFESWNDLLLPNKVSHGACFVEFLVSRTLIKRRKSSSAQCHLKTDSKKRIDSFYRCLNENQSKLNCSVLDPRINQSMSDLCPGRELELIRNALIKNDSSCTKFNYCIDNQYLYTTVVSEEKYEITAPEPLILSATQQTVAKKCGQDGLLYAFRYQSASGSPTWVEESSVSTTTYIGYVGGNLGVFFGFNAVAGLQLFMHAIQRESGSNMRRGVIFRMLRYFLSVILIICFVLLVNESSTKYINLASASQVVSALDWNLKRFSIISPWVSAEKLNQSTQLSESFWAEENMEMITMRRIGSFKKPLMCELIQALYPMNPQLPGSNSFHKISRIDKLEEILSSNIFIREEGIAKWTKTLARSTDAVIVNITDGLKQALVFESSQKLSLYGIVNQIDVRYNRSNFLKQTSSLRFNFNKAGNGPCDLGGPQAWIMVFTDQVEIDDRSSFAVFYPWSDHIVKVARQTYHANWRKDRPCISRESAKPGCIFSCLKEKLPCSCDELWPIQGEPVPMITNLTNMCHSYRPLLTQCPKLRYFNADILRKCSNECRPPCHLSIYSASVLSLERHGDFQDVMTVTINIDDTSPNLSISEFYIYDIISYLCTVCACFSMIFGTTFITVMTSVGSNVRWLAEKLFDY